MHPEHNINKIRLRFLLFTMMFFEQDCQIFFGYPGDRMDNDCDDMVDEDICTLDDIGKLIELELFFDHIIPAFDPFTNKPWFLHVCSTSHLKTLWEKEKLL